MTDLHILATANDCHRAAADHIVKLSAQATQDRGSFSIALSGGSTPRGLYELLTREPYASSIEWQRWQVFFGDERGVPPDHPESNFRMAKEALFDHVALPQGRVHRLRGEAQLEEAAAAYEKTLRQTLGESPALDLVLLGIGADGHTASLFPGTPALGEERRWVVAVRTGAPAGTPRLTMTLPLLNQARSIVFLATDAAKAEMVRRAIAPHSSEPAIPASLVRPSNGSLHWFLTTEAASALSKATA